MSGARAVGAAGAAFGSVQFGGLGAVGVDTRQRRGIDGLALGQQPGVGRIHREEPVDCVCGLLGGVVDLVERCEELVAGLTHMVVTDRAGGYELGCRAWG